jgi:hypothetical protein
MRDDRGYNVWRNGYSYVGAHAGVAAWVLEPEPGAMILCMSDTGGTLIRMVFYPDAYFDVADLEGYGVLALGGRYVGATIWMTDFPAIVFRVIDARRS